MRSFLLMHSKCKHSLNHWPFSNKRKKYCRCFGVGANWNANWILKIVWCSSRLWTYPTVAIEKKNRVGQIDCDAKQAFYFALIDRCSCNTIKVCRIVSACFYPSHVLHFVVFDFSHRLVIENHCCIMWSIATYSVVVLHDAIMGTMLQHRYRQWQKTMQTTLMLGIQFALI